MIRQFTLLSALCLSSALAQPLSAEPVHGFAMQGAPLLPAGFDNLPYANPQAPQGGVLGLQNATLSAALRLEHVDFNVGSFSSTGQRIFDEVTAIVPGLSFRPTAGTVFKANYRRHWTRDLLGNPTTRMGGYQVGFATYF